VIARYWVAQYVSDLFRNEPRNVGVFVECNGQSVARFFGEADDLQIDGRKLKNFQNPDVYRQWVEFWRKTMNQSGIEKLTSGASSHFRVIAGGDVTDMGNDTVADVMAYLYSVLVATGGITEALLTGSMEDMSTPTALAVEIGAALEQRSLLSNESKQVLVPHPVKRAEPVRGKVVGYRPAFVQRNGALYVMETVDFTSPKKKIARDHAGFSAYMFKDIRDADPRANMIAIVRVADSDQDADEVRDGLALLKNEGEIVNWMNEDEQAIFLEERRRIAIST
jgi:hypothetical protein